MQETGHSEDGAGCWPGLLALTHKLPPVLLLLAGWNKNGIVLACDFTDPVLCTDANATRIMTVKQICPLNVAKPAQTVVASGAPLVMSAGTAAQP